MKLKPLTIPKVKTNSRRLTKMREAAIKKWLDNILEAWEDYKELEAEEKPDDTIKRICKLYSKSDLARALLILKPLEKPEK